MDKNVADVLGKKLNALSVQCELNPNEETMICSGTNNPTPEYFQVDWGAEVDSITARNVQVTRGNRFKFLGHDLISLNGPMGPEMTCMPRLSSGRGDVNLLCTQNKSELNRFHKDWKESKEELRKRNLKFNQL